MIRILILIMLCYRSFAQVCILFDVLCFKQYILIYKDMRMDSVHIGTAMFCQVGSDVCVNFEVKQKAL